MQFAYIVCRKNIMADTLLDSHILGVYTNKDEAERAVTLFNLQYNNDVQIIMKYMNIEPKSEGVYFCFNVSFKMLKDGYLYYKIKDEFSTLNPLKIVRENLQNRDIYLDNIMHCIMPYWVKLTDLDLIKSSDYFQWLAHETLLNKFEQTFDDIYKLIERTKMYIDPQLILPEQKIELVSFDFDNTFNLDHVTEDAKKIFSTLIEQFQQVFKEVFDTYCKSEFYTKFNENEKNKLINKIQKILYSVFPKAFNMNDRSVVDLFKIFITIGDCEFVNKFKLNNQ